MNNCEGCSSLKVGMNKRHYVCVSVDRGILDSCPCQECLIMIVCGNVCEKFYEIAGLNNAVFSNEFISKLTVETLSRIRRTRWGSI